MLHGSRPLGEFTLAMLDAELREGLACAVPAWSDAMRQLAYYEMRGAELIQPRPAETANDFAGRPKVAIHLTRRVITELAKGLYSCGPTRELASPAGQVLLDQVYAANHVDSLLQLADSMAWLHGVFAIQVWPTGRLDASIRLYPWRRDEFHVWCTEDDPTDVQAVCVRSLFEGRKQIRYQVWSDTEVRTYWTPVGDCDPIGRQSRILTFDPGASGVHGLGVLPFVFCHSTPPVVSFDTPGLGKPLAEISAVLDSQVSDLAQSIRTHCIPARYADNVASVAEHVHRPDTLIDLVAHDRTKEARIFFVQPDLAVEQVWYHLQRLANQTLQDLDLPLTADVDALSAPESGVAIVARRMPLIDLWTSRQTHWERHEAELARTTLIVAGNFHGRGDWRGAAAAPLTVTFPPPRLPLPTPERNEADSWELEQGLTSRIRITMTRYGLTRAQAVKRLQQTVEDLAEERAIYGAAESEADPEEEEDQGDDGSPDVEAPESDPDSELPGE
jgi:hypothetical protein